MKVLLATAMYPTPENPAFGSFVRTQVEALKQAGVQIELLLLTGRPRKLIYPKGVIELHRRLADNPIDLVHAHYSYVGMVARAQWKVPVVVTYHGDDLLGTVANQRGEHTRSSRFIVAAGQALGQMVDAAIVQTEEMACKIKSKTRVYVVPHEVDFDLFRPIDKAYARTVLGLDPHQKYLLFAAKPETHVKNYPFAKAVADQLAQRDPSVELLVVHKETQERLTLFMNACDALIFPSFQEGSPNIVKQAMACNLPIVATKVGDVQEIIGRTKGCYICKLDVVEFVEKLGQILHHPERTEGRAHIRHFASPLVTQKIIRVYEETLKEYKARRGYRDQNIRYRETR
jgi:glycosyltransferase involved in cell wall biosynthesis